MGFSGKKYHEYGMRNAWKKHENPLNIQRFMAHEKTPTNKKPMKMPWNKMKPTKFFHGFLMIMKKPWIEKLFFMVSEFMGFSWGFLNSCPIKKHEFSVNGWILMVHEKWNGFWWHFHYPWIIPLAYFSCERKIHDHHENLVLNYSWLLNQIHHWGFVGCIYTCSNNPNPK